jgi:hypothetical protein
MPPRLATGDARRDRLARAQVAGLPGDRGTLGRWRYGAEEGTVAGVLGDLLLAGSRGRGR